MTIYIEIESFEEARQLLAVVMIDCKMVSMKKKGSKYIIKGVNAK